MIKINLIPAKRKRKPKAVPPFIIAMVLLLAVSFVVVLFVSMSVSAKIDDLEVTKRANDEKIAALQKKIKEVKDFEKLNRRFQDRKNIIEQLTRNQSVPVRILDEVSSRLTDGIWLTSMNVTSDRITLSGKGFSNTDIVAFVQHLKGSELFRDVLLKGTSRQIEKGVETYKFDLVMGVKK